MIELFLVLFIPLLLGQTVRRVSRGYNPTADISEITGRPVTIDEVQG